jgi:hypothetical protein
VQQFMPQPGDTFDLFDFGTANGAFDQINFPAGTTAQDWNTTHLLAPSSDPLSGSLIFIPEPATWVLLLLGASALVTRRRRVKP